MWSAVQFCQPHQARWGFLPHYMRGRGILPPYCRGISSTIPISRMGESFHDPSRGGSRGDLSAVFGLSLFALLYCELFDNEIVATSGKTAWMDAWQLMSQEKVLKNCSSIHE